MPPKIQLARRKARDLLQAAGVDTAPVPVKKIAASLHATIKYEPFQGGLSGMLHRDGQHTLIGVNALHPKVRQRFTIAHELGHLLMHRNEKLHVDSRFPVALRNEVSSLAIDDREIEANQFAAELLMPEELLDRDIAALPTELEVDEAISRLAKRYIVSVQAMTLRLTALRILC